MLLLQYVCKARQNKRIFKSLFLQILTRMPPSYNINLNECPNHFMTLDAIARGMANTSKIAKVTKVNDDAEIELIINDLLTQRLIVKSEIRGFLGRKRLKLE